jgi:hypothetical protein
MRPFQQSLISNAPSVSTPPVSHFHAVSYVIEGSDAGSGVTELDMKHGHLSIGPEHPGIPVPDDLQLVSFASSFLSTNTPSGPGTATVQVRYPGGTSFVNLVSFEVPTSE